MAEDKLEFYKKKRTVLRIAVTKFLTKLENYLSSSEVTVDGLEENLETLSIKFKELKENDQILETLFSSDDLEKELESAGKYSDNVELWKFRASKRLRDLKTADQLNFISQLEMSNVNNNDQYSGNSESRQQCLRVKLPKLTIPKFYGNINEWMSFWNTFESSIHKNEFLSKIDKFNYLKAHLGGSALNTIQGFAISEHAYDSALELLKSRFANENLLIHNHMTNILNIRPLKQSNDIHAFRKFYDKVSTELRSLECLGTNLENISCVLCTTILKAIPQDLLIELNRGENASGYYDIKKLMDFLLTCLISREKALLLSSQFNTSGNKEKFLPPKIEKVQKLPSANELISTNIREGFDRTKCLFCDSVNHSASLCDFAETNLSLEDRKKILMKKGACFRCLEAKKHISRQCKKSMTCVHCNGKHASLMCFSKYQTKREDKNDSSGVTENTLLSNQSFSKRVYLQTLIARISNGNTEYFVRVILDTASSKSYVSKFISEKLGLQSLGKVKVTHGLFGGSETTMCHDRYSVNLSNLCKSNNIEIEVMEQKKICATVPRINDPTCVKELKDKGIFLSDISPKSRDCLYEQDLNEVHVLLGADTVGKLFTGKIENLSCGLVAIETILGWTTLGKINDSINDSSLLVLSLFVNDAKITDLWNLDSLGILDPVEKKSKNEVQNLVFKHFRETVCRENDGRYKVCLPWIDSHPPLPSNKNLAEKRLNNNVKSLKSHGLLQGYEQVFNEWEEEGIIEKVNIGENSDQTSVHYLPHRAVIKPNSTTKIRPVFDGSAHSKDSVSINDCIEKGPNLIELIPTILNRFRWGEIGVVADIRRAFLQIALNEKDRDYLRFFWWKDGDPENLIIYKHCRVVFGISCSPFLLAATLMHHLDQAPENVKNVALKLKESLYVDNCVASVDSLEELDYFRTEAKKLLASAKFDLRGWCHNKHGKNELDETIKVDSNYNEENKIPLLGLLWDTEKDTLSCDFRSNWDNDDDDFVTKRTILSLAHKIFDPIGFTCPVTLIPKLLLQKCWKIKSSWDSKLPEDIVKEFKKWKNQVTELGNIFIPRRLSHLPLCTGKLSLHIFCDASKTSYATCIFLRAEFQSDVTCQLVQARSRVSPLKEISIPRLELLACCIGARLADSVVRDFNLGNVDKFYWSDSMDALYWIKGEGPWATFVENRVKEIRQLSSMTFWNFVPGHMNAADLPSRGCSAKSLSKSEWWLGPDWLRKSEDDWPKSNVIPNMQIINAERKKKIISASNLEDNEVKFYNRYSSYTKILRITGWILRFCKNSRKIKDNRTFGELNSEELRNAEKVLLKLVQKDAFVNSSDNRLKCLQVISDNDGILRIKTKTFLRDDYLNFRLPVVLPSDHNVVEQLIMTKHRQLGHCGVQLLMTALREDYWILKSRQTIKRTINKCAICKRFTSKPPDIIESVLPVDRVRNAAVFEIVGMDLAGPLYLKDDSKIWILIITCAVFRAVHLELLSSPSTDSFILGLTRFISRRGRPSVVYTDNGTGFVGGQKLLRNIDIEKLKDHSQFSFIEWKFIPPSAPWWGGFWERLVGVMKRILRRVLGKSSLTYEEMTTVLCDCESIINSRPLTYVTENTDDLKPLVPAMFLHEITDIGIPELECLDHKKINKRYKYRVRLREDLRSRFRSEYLGSLRNSLTSKNAKPLRVGDVVIIWTDNTKRINWPLGKIVEVYPSQDGVVRVAKVQTAKGTFVRPIKKLCPLELAENTDICSDPDRVATRRGRVVRRPKKYPEV